MTKVSLFADTRAADFSVTKNLSLGKRFVAVNSRLVNELRVIALTHRNFPLETIGKFHIAPEKREATLKNIRQAFGISELMYLSTCNRVELVFTLPHYVCPGITAKILQALHYGLSDQDAASIAASVQRFNGNEAAEHLLNVASSMDSLVVGEREIITQLRKSYEESAAMGLTGDAIRIVITQCIKTAKEVFTHTDLAKRPVSVVSLAWNQFRSHSIRHDARVLLVGAGQIIRNFMKFLHENGYNNLIVANRTQSKAQLLCEQYGGRAISMEDLKNYSEGFDALVTCTSSEEAIITPDLYTQLLSGEQGSKLIIDLALPADVDHSIVLNHAVKYIGMEDIQREASQNIQFREQALTECEPIIRNGMRDLEKVWQARQIEQAMRTIPETIRDIRNTALGSVFAKDLENLDENSKEVLEKIMNYMEKKYISIPMKMAREVLLNEVSKN